MNSVFNYNIHNIQYPGCLLQTIEQLEKSMHLKITNISVEDTTPTIDYSNSFSRKLFPITYIFEFDIVNLIINDKVSYHIKAQVDARFLQSKVLDVACGLIKYHLQVSSNSIKNILRYGYVLYYIYRLALQTYGAGIYENEFEKYIKLLSCNCSFANN